MYVCMYVCMCMFRSSYMYRQMCSLNFSLLSCTHVQVYLQIISIYMYIYNTYMYMYIYLLTLLVIVSLCICLSTKKPLSTRTCNNIPKEHAACMNTYKKPFRLTPPVKPTSLRGIAPKLWPMALYSESAKLDGWVLGA